jgi:hypothetical protein
VQSPRFDPHGNNPLSYQQHCAASFVAAPVAQRENKLLRQKPAASVLYHKTANNTSTLLHSLNTPGIQQYTIATLYNLLYSKATSRLLAKWLYPSFASAFLFLLGKQKKRKQQAMCST